MTKDLKESLQELRKPLKPSEIEWKVQSYTKDKSKTIIVPYIDNRAVMSRLDDIFGLDGWTSEFRAVPKGFICRITIGDLYREDGANETKIEPVKGGISDAMKRAASQLGLGRELYNFPRVFLTGEHSYIPNDTLKRLDKMVIAITKGDFTKSVVTL